MWIFSSLNRQNSRLNYRQKVKKLINQRDCFLYPVSLFCEEDRMDEKVVLIYQKKKQIPKLIELKEDYSLNVRNYLKISNTGDLNPDTELRRI